MLVLGDIQRHVLDVTMFHNMVNSVKLMHRSARCKRPTVHVLWYYSIYSSPHELHCHMLRSVATHEFPSKS